MAQNRIYTILHYMYNTVRNLQNSFEIETDRFSRIVNDDNICIDFHVYKVQSK